MEFKDYYKVLDIAKTAPFDEIKKAYRKLARKHHPDVSKAADATARMAELNEAYDVLSNAEKRLAYDSLADAPNREAGREFQPPPNWDTGFEFSDGDGQEDSVGGARGGLHSDFFEQLFGRAARGQRNQGRPTASPQRGQDHHAKIELDLLDAFHGAKRSLSLRTARMNEAGAMVADTRELEVSVPVGVYAGQHIRLKGQGSAGYGDAPAGDLLLEVVFKPDGRWHTEGRDVHQRIRLSPWEAMLGATVTVQTPGGEAQVVIPADWKSGRKLRLKGRGIPSAREGEAGHVMLELELALPPAQSDEARAAYSAMASAFADYNPRG